MRFEAGSQFAGYTVLSRLGRGGMATVYLVREPGIDRLVALKVLPEHLVDDTQFSARFEQEARLIGSLDHPNIIPLYRYGITDDVPWMALRYVDGGDFATRLAVRPLPVPEGLAMLRGVAAALDYAHRKGVIHRDLKPQNILLTGDGAVYLADFGVAKMLEGTSSANTAAGEVLGSPPYMSPEQAQGLQLGPYTDVYAFAVICYQWLTGSLPFNADTPQAILIKHIMEPLPTDSLRLLSPSVAAVLERGLAKQPEQRFQSASALIAELEQALYSAATVAVAMNAQPAPSRTPLSQPASTKRSAAPAAADAASGSSRRWMWIASSALVLAAAVAGYLYWPRAAPSPQQRPALASNTQSPPPAPTPPGAFNSKAGQPAEPASPTSVSVAPAHTVAHAESALSSPVSAPKTTHASVPRLPAKPAQPTTPSPAPTSSPVSAGFGQQALANGDQSNAGATADTSSGVAETKMGMNIRLTCADGAGANANANTEYLPSWNPRGNQALCVLKRRFPMLQGAETVRATVDASGQPVLRFTYKSETAQRFAGLALQGPDRRLAVVFNGKVLGSAVIRTTAQGGEIDVTGLGERQTQGFARRLQSYLDSNESQPHAEP